MESSDYYERASDRKRTERETGERSPYLVITVTDDSLEGAGISASEKVIVELQDVMRDMGTYDGKLLCFANRHNELMIGRFAPPYIELLYRDRTYRIPMGDRRVVGVMVANS